MNTGPAIENLGPNGKTAEAIEREWQNGVAVLRHPGPDKFECPTRIGCANHWSDDRRHRDIELNDEIAWTF